MNVSAWQRLPGEQASRGNQAPLETKSSRSDGESLQKADKNLGTLRNELSYRKSKQSSGGESLQFQPDIHCCKCQQRILSGEGYGFVCFTVPGEEVYQFFHNRSRPGDCWEAYLKNGKPA